MFCKYYANNNTSLDFYTTLPTQFKNWDIQSSNLAWDVFIVDNGLGPRQSLQFLFAITYHHLLCHILVLTLDPLGRSGEIAFLMKTLDISPIGMH